MIRRRSRPDSRAATGSGVPKPVRPRVLWSGMAVTLIAMTCLGAGAAIGSVPWSVAGAIGLFVGLVTAWLGGILRDVHITRSPTRVEARQVEQDDVHPGDAATDRLQGPAIASRTRAINEATRERLSRPAPRPSVDRAAGLVLIMLSVWLLVCPAVLGYPFSAEVTNARLREQGLAVVLELAGIWRLLVGRSRVAFGVGLVAGLALLVSAAVMQPESGVIAVNEAVIGALVILATVAANDQRA